MRNALTGVERALFLTLAFAAFAAVAAGLAARGVDRVAAWYQANESNYMIVQVQAPEGDAGITAAQLALANSQHVVAVTPVSGSRAAEFLGGSVRAEDLPEDLRLIEVEVAPAAPQVDVAGDLVAALAQGGVTAEVFGNGTAEGGLATWTRSAAFWGSIAFALVMALIISLSARGLAARRREMVTVMCDLGATQGKAAGRVADEAAVMGLYAGLIGGALAGVAGLIVLMLVIPGVSLDALPRMILPVDLVPIAAAPLVAAISAGAGARAAASYFHAQAARLG